MSDKIIEKYIQELINSDAVANLTLCDLQFTRNSLLEDLKDAENGDGKFIFSINNEEEVRALKRLVKSFNRVIDWYGGK